MRDVIQAEMAKELSSRRNNRFIINARKWLISRGIIVFLGQV